MSPGTLPSPDSTGAVGGSQLGLLGKTKAGVKVPAQIWPE